MPVFSPGPTTSAFRPNSLWLSSWNAGVRGGTTLETTTPSTAEGSRPASRNRSRSRIPYSSAVFSGSDRARHSLTRLFPLKTPRAMVVFPMSTARSMCGFSRYDNT
jgi:hypothetical protein